MPRPARRASAGRIRRRSRPARRARARRAVGRRPQRVAELVVRDRRIAARARRRRTSPRRGARASAITRSPSRAGGSAIAVPSRRNSRTPRSRSSCRTTAAIGAPMPNALTVTRGAEAAVAVVSPRSSLTQRDVVEPLGDARDAARIADQDRAVADLLGPAAQVPALVRHSLLLSSTARREQRSAGRDAGPRPRPRRRSGRPAAAATTPATSSSPAPVVSATGSASTARRRPAAPRDRARRPPRASRSRARPAPGGPAPALGTPARRATVQMTSARASSARDQLRGTPRVGLDRPHDAAPGATAPARARSPRRRDREADQSAAAIASPCAASSSRHAVAGIEEAELRPPRS